jgi:hypothetical protein
LFGRISAETILPRKLNTSPLYCITDFAMKIFIRPETLSRINLLRVPFDSKDYDSEIDRSSAP